MSTISKAIVLSIKEYGNEVREYSLQLEKNHYFDAGTFLLLTLEKKSDYTRWPESRNFSIASAYNNDGIVKLIIRKVGVYTTRIFNELHVGSECVVKYAFGDFLLPFFDKKAAICCVAAGTGIAPILSFCEQLKQSNMQSRLHVFYSFKNESEMLGADLLKSVVPAEQLHLFCTRQEMGGIPNRRMIWNDIQGIDFSYKTDHFYICGGEEFTDKFSTYLEKVGVENVYTDEW